MIIDNEFVMSMIQIELMFNSIMMHQLEKYVMMDRVKLLLITNFDLHKKNYGWDYFPPIRKIFWLWKKLSKILSFLTCSIISMDYIIIRRNNDKFSKWAMAIMMTMKMMIRINMITYGTHFASSQSKIRLTQKPL